MAVQRIRYKVTWSKRGERGDEEPLTVVAHLYRTEGDFFTFYNQDPQWRPPILIIRTSDVREIQEISDDG